MMDTYGLLRASSDHVGSAAQSVLGIQGNLDVLRQDLSGEYDRWEQKRSFFASERQSLLAQADRMQAVLREHVTMREERPRLEGELRLLEAEGQKSRALGEERRRTWSLELRALQQEAPHFQALLQKGRERSRGHLVLVLNGTAHLREEKGKAQQRVADLKRQAAELEANATKQRDSSAQMRAYLSAQIQLTQERAKNLSKDVASQALQRAEANRTAAAAGRLAKQREALRATKAGCADELQRLDNGILAAKRAARLSSAEVTSCQAVDAKNQELQGLLSRCRATLRGGAGDGLTAGETGQ